MNAESLVAIGRLKERRGVAALLRARIADPFEAAQKLLKTTGRAGAGVVFVLADGQVGVAADHLALERIEDKEDVNVLVRRCAHCKESGAA